MCFEILGFDIMIDKDCKPLLLEVNHAPSFGTASPLDYDIKHALFRDTFKLLGMTVEKKRDIIKR
jgi:tubulin polyglutamylase TTLL6/13